MDRNRTRRPVDGNRPRRPMDGNRRRDNSNSDRRRPQRAASRNDSQSRNQSRGQATAGHQSSGRETTGTPEPEIQPDDSHRRHGELVNALFRELRDKQKERQERLNTRRSCQIANEPRTKFANAEEAIREQRLIRERYIILQQQRIWEDEERRAQEAAREQEALRERLNTRRRRPAQELQLAADAEDASNDEEDEDDGDEAEEEAGEEEEVEEEGEGEDDGEGGEESEEDEDGDDEIDSDDEEELDDSDEDSPTLYTWNEHRVAYRRRRTFTYLKRHAGELSVPRPRSLGVSSDQVGSTKKENESEPGTEGPSTSQAALPPPVVTSVMPFWKRFSFAKDEDFEYRLHVKAKADPRPEPLIIRNTDSRSNSDKSSLDGENRPRDCRSNEDAAKKTHEDYERLFELQAQMEKSKPPKRRLFGQIAPVNGLSPIPEVSARQEEKYRSIHERYMSDQPSTSKAADEADAEILRLAREAMDPDWTAANSEEHIARLAEEKSSVTRELVSPEEYFQDIDIYTDNLLDTAARKCQAMLEPRPLIDWGRVNPLMIRFLNSIPDGPMTDNQPGASPSAGLITDNNPLPVTQIESTTAICRSQRELENVASIPIVADEYIASATNVGREREKLNTPDQHIANWSVATHQSSTAYQSLFMNPAADTRYVTPAQHIVAEHFVFGQWSMVNNHFITMDQEAATKTVTSPSKTASGNIFHTISKKRKRGDDNDFEEKEDDRKSNPTSPSLSRKRRCHSDDETCDKDTENRKKRKPSASPRKRKTRDESSDPEDEVKRRRT